MENKIFQVLLFFSLQYLLLFVIPFAICTEDMFKLTKRQIYLN